MDEKNHNDFWDIKYKRPVRRLRPLNRDTDTVYISIKEVEKTEPDNLGDIPSPETKQTVHIQDQTKNTDLPAAIAGQPNAKTKDFTKPTLEELIHSKIIVPGSSLCPPSECAAHKQAAQADLLLDSQINFLKSPQKELPAPARSAPDAEDTSQLVHKPQIYSENGRQDKKTDAGNNLSDAAQKTGCEPAVATPPGFQSWEPKEFGGEIPRPGEGSEAAEPYFCYNPNDNKLIHEVKIALWPSPYSFYDRFRSDARRYIDHTAQPCEPQPFFSFMPQYMQLNIEQRSWYFYWRSLVRGGKYLSVDFGYIMLYIYELINLSDIIEPADVLNMLCDLWLGYRELHPRLDRYLSEWVCDLCLINRLPLPYERLAPIYPKIVAAAKFKEFYAGSVKGLDSPFAEALFNFNSSYNWRQSKFLTDENRHLFEAHIRGAFMYACGRLEDASAEEMSISSRAGLLSTALRSYGARQRVIRDSYSGALCSYQIKRRLEINFSSCTSSAELRIIVTDMVKYAENNVRSLIGVKSRFNTPNLPQAAREFIYNYFAPLRVKPGKKAPEPPEYERLYEAAGEGLSTEAAMLLERSSWETTRRLVNAFEDQDAHAEQPHSKAQENISQAHGFAACGDTGNGSSKSGNTDKDRAAFSGSKELSSFDVFLSGSPDGPQNDPNAFSGGISSFENKSSDAGTDLSQEASHRSDFAECARAYMLIRTKDFQGFSAFAEKLNIMAETLAERLNEYAYDIIGDIAAQPSDSVIGWRILDDYAAELDEHFGCKP